MNDSANLSLDLSLSGSSFFIISFKSYIFSLLLSSKFPESLGASKDFQDVYFSNSYLFSLVSSSAGFSVVFSTVISLTGTLFFLIHTSLDYSPSYPIEEEGTSLCSIVTSSAGTSFSVTVTDSLGVYDNDWTSSLCCYS